MMDGSPWRQALAHLPDYLSQHVLLSVSSLALGLVISLPLALLATRSRALRGPILGVAGIIQTIPGLALVALFYPLLLALSHLTLAIFGFSFRALGFLPALMALTLYSMLPVLQNTITGLAGIDPAAKVAARGVGMTVWQSLWLVELPLAAPVILAGIRTAAAWVIGTATLATPIGQTSLGNYIFTGLQTENWVYVLFGCVAAAALSVVVDRLLALIQDGLTRRSRRRLAVALAALFAVVGASLLPLIGSGRDRVIVGSKPAIEQYILGALIQDRLGRAGIPAVRRTGLGSTVLFDALAANEVDVYVDYSGTIWTNEMHRTDMPGRKTVLEQVTAWLMREHHIRVVGSLGFEDRYTLAMPADRASSMHIASIDDLAAYAPSMRIGGDLEVFSRPEWRALTEKYGLHFAAQRQYQSNFLFGALMTHDVDVVMAYSSDGRIAKYGLKLLSDRKEALPPYDALLLVSPRRAHDARLLAALEPLVGALSLATMQHANFLVQGAAVPQSPAAVGRMLSNAIKP